MAVMTNPFYEPYGAFMFLFLYLTRTCVKGLATCGTNSVGVWDGVLAIESRTALHQVARHLGSSRHFLFERPIDAQNSGLIERTLDAILTEMSDASKYVEFWTRQDWRSIEAHADVDEMLAKSEDGEGNSMSKPFRFPRNGHVLYLQRGEEVRGPTCVFPNRQSGGDLLRPLKACGDKEGAAAVELVTVPAVPGRLLRFQGDYLHAVPRPHDLWFRKFVQGAPSYSPEQTWGRSVILFNTWGDDGPLDVKTRSPIAENELTSNHSLCEAQTAWKSAYDESHGRVEGTCNSDSAEESIKAKVWLLGNERRRNHEMRTLSLMAPKSLPGALEEESTVRRTVLQQL